ncbi:MAG: PAS domain S-box protein [Sedimentisphaerales bacterium]|nr:PAS domain S-box protein [Sedimentisphaerales bacterium]
MLSEKTFKKIFNNSVDGILVVDVEKESVLLANRVFCEMTGYSQEEAKNLTFQKLHRQEDMSYVIEQFRLQAAGKLLISRDLPFMKKNGSIFYADIHSIDIYFDNRRYMIGIFRDVTSQKKIKDELAFKTTVLETQLETTIDGILVVDENGKTVLVNKRFAELWNIPQHILDTKSDEKMIRYVVKMLKEPEEFTNKIKYLYSHNTEKSTDEIKFKDGRTVERHSFPMVERTGSLLGRIWYFRDITDQKKIIGALRESEDKYRALVESTSETIAVIDINGVFAYMNIIAAQRLGGKPEDFTGKTMWDLFPKNIADRQMSNIRKVINMRHSITESSQSELQGQMRWYETTITPLDYSKSGVPTAIIHARDVTERNKTQEELNTYRQEMAHAERLASLGTLSATAAHELAQPLTVMRLLIENAMTKLEQAASPQDVTDKLRESLIEISNITSVVDRFRNFARKSSENIIREVNLNTIACRIVNLLKESSHHSEVELIINKMDELPLIYSNEKDIEQMFFALIHNAIHAAVNKKDQKVIISGSAFNDYVELRFADNCCGIAPENMERIFEPFFTTKPPGQGTGLGLCIVRDIVSRAGGKIRVESELGQGSTFFVTLPLNKDMK